METKGFLKKISPILLSILFTTLIFVGILLLSEDIKGSIILSIQIIAFFLLIYIAIALIFYEQSKSKAEKMEELCIEFDNFREQTRNEQSEMQDYFLMWVHQIKTPITVSKLIVDTMELGEAKHKLMPELLAIEDYSNMAINYLKISNTNNMDISEIELDKIIRPIIKKYSIVFIRNHIQLIYNHIDKKIITDPKWLSILIEQLISNATKYTKNGKVGIVFDHTNNRLEIYDTGIGICSEDIPKIFNKGYSGFNGRANQKSSGLGLFMAKKIATKLNLTISVTSKIDEGSHFYIEFPSKDI